MAVWLAVRLFVDNGHCNGPAGTRHAAVAIVSPGLSFEAAGHGVRSAMAPGEGSGLRQRSDSSGYAIDARMKKLGRGELYAKELARLTKAESLPAGWATPEQRSRAALRIVSRKRN